MAHPITDRAALEFSREFYTHLAEGGSVHAAVYEGRWAIHRLRSAEWAITLWLALDAGDAVPPAGGPTGGDEAGDPVRLPGLGAVVLRRAAED